MSEGLMTIAFGSQRYIRMAQALARSYRRHNSKRPFAVVTDEANLDVMGEHFDEVIPVRPEYGSGVVQKLSADRYSPFDRTLFVDSDCLFYKHPDRIWEIYTGKPFRMRGWRYLTGSTDYEEQHRYDWVKDTTSFLRINNITRLPHFNSGVFYFERSDTAVKVFTIARSLYERRDSLGFVEFKNAPIADEPAFAVAMELSGVAMDDWDNQNGMETAIGMHNAFSINVLAGQARYLKNGVEVDPVLIHFNVGAQDDAIYWREIHRLKFERSLFCPLLVEAAVLARAVSEQLARVYRFRGHRWTKSQRGR
jgi:hypothetical protein